MDKDMESDPEMYGVLNRYYCICKNHKYLLITGPFGG